MTNGARGDPRQLIWAVIREARSGLLARTPWSSFGKIVAVRLFGGDPGAALPLCSTSKSGIRLQKQL